MELQNLNDREGGAELVLNLQPISSISIGYHPSFGPHDDLMLLELDEKLLPDILHERCELLATSIVNPLNGVLFHVTLFQTPFMMSYHVVFAFLG